MENFNVWKIFYRYYFCMLIILTSINCTPLDLIISRRRSNINVAEKPTGVTPPEILEFMRKFGYLESSSSTSEALYHEDAVIAAIRNVQKYGALNESGVLDNATLKLMTAPRCGVSDMPRNVQKSNRSKRYIIGSGGWQKRRITYFIANWSPKVGEDKVAIGMRSAFNLWSKYSNLRFIRVYDPDADIIVAFGSGYHGDRFPFDGPGSVLAHAFYPYEMSTYGGDIHFDDDENWRENATHLSEGVDFQSVAVHELGHSLGLAHSPVFSSIMFPYYKGPRESRDLNYDDVMAMYELYIKKVLEDDEYLADVETTTNADFYETSTLISNDTRNRPATKPPLKNPATTTTNPEKNKSTFDGDYESVDRHKERFGFTTNAPSSSTVPLNIPNLCDGNGFDAVSLLRGEIFIFKDEYLWRLTDKYRIKSGYPVKFKDIFTAFPESVKHIDAVYERSHDNSIILFSGNQYWCFDGSAFIENSPRSITDYGFDSTVSKIDAAMVWSKNSRTYLFAGSKFIRFNEETRRIDDNYPANISDKWYGIPNNIDAATSVGNGKTYFFKGNLYWLYDNYWIRPERGYPRRASTIWLGCPLQLRQHRRRLRQRTMRLPSRIETTIED